MSKRQHEDHIYDSLRLATRELILSAGGLENAAKKTRVAKSTLASYYDPNSNVFIPVDVIADLEAHLNDLPVSRALARLKNVFICEVPPADQADMIEYLADVADRVGSVFRESGTALAHDADLDHKSIASLRDAIYECFRSLLLLENRIQNAALDQDDQVA